MRLGLGIGLQFGRRAGGGAAAPVGILDSYTGAAFAFAPDVLIYSAHSVTDSAVGSATNGQAGQYTVRVRRSSDNAVSSFTYTEVSDGTLTTWVGAGNDGFVEAGYDQGTNGNHGTQGTAANQPRIVVAGSLVVENGKAALNFTSASQLTMSSVVTVESAYIAAKINAFLPLNYVLFNNMPSGLARGFFWGGTFTGIDGIGFFDGTVKSISGEDTNIHLGYFSYNVDAYDIAKDGEPATSFSTSTPIDIIALGRSNSSFSLNGNYSFVTIYPSGQSTNRAAIETAINNEYNIY